jgi:hypothetical protein
MVTTEAEPIVSYYDDHGFVFIYTHSDDEPQETLLAATAIAMNVAAEQAVKERKTYVVASTPVPSYTVFVLPFGHPLIAERGLDIMNRLMSNGQRVRSPRPKKH